MAFCLSEPFTELGLKGGDFVGVDVDAPMVAGDFAVVEYRGGVFVRQVSRSDLSLQIHIGGQSWPLIRAGWGGRLAPVAFGKVFASGRPL